MKNKSTHQLYYLSLLIMELLVGSLILFKQGDAPKQLFYGMLAALIYVVWGIAHHAINHTLHKKIIFEYFLMGTLGVSVLYFFLR